MQAATRADGSDGCCHLNSLHYFLSFKPSKMKKWVLMADWLESVTYTWMQVTPILMFSTGNESTLLLEHFPPLFQRNSPSQHVWWEVSFQDNYSYFQSSIFWGEITCQSLNWKEGWAPITAKHSSSWEAGKTQLWAFILTPTVAKIPLLQPQCCDNPTVVWATFCLPCHSTHSKENFNWKRK